MVGCTLSSLRQRGADLAPGAETPMASRGVILSSGCTGSVEEGFGFAFVHDFFKKFRRCDDNELSLECLKQRCVVYL